MSPTDALLLWILDHAHPLLTGAGTAALGIVAIRTIFLLKCLEGRVSAVEKRPRRGRGEDDDRGQFLSSIVPMPGGDDGGSLAPISPRPATDSDKGYSPRRVPKITPPPEWRGGRRAGPPARRTFNHFTESQTMIRCILVFLLALLCGAEPMPQPLSLNAPSKVEAYRQVRVNAVGNIAGAALVWDVSPEDKADMEEMPGGKMVFTAPPGVYRIKCRAIRLKDGAATADCARATVEISPPPGNAPPAPGPVVPPRGGKADPAAATTRLSVGNSGCTATIMFPRRPDGKWDVLTASHCTGEKGGKGKIRLKDGRSLNVTVAARSRTPDITWLVTDDSSLDDLPYAILAGSAPEPGTKIWHNGYGVDKPGNREEGAVVSGPGSDGMLTMRLSVSSGDSGGGIFRVDNGELVSCVCCTSAMARFGEMHGGSCVAAAKLRPKSSADDTLASSRPVHFLPPPRRPVLPPLRPRVLPQLRPRLWRPAASQAQLVADAATVAIRCLTSPLRW